MVPEQTDQTHSRDHAEVVHQTRPVTQKRPEKTITQEVETKVEVAATPAAAPAELAIPLSVVSRADISRSLRELESIMDYFHQASIRGSKAQELPVLGKALDSLATANGLNMLHPQDRDKLKTFLTHVKAKAPVVHMSFPSKPGEPFLAKIIEWFRKEAHPYTVLHVGLQPELAAGCLVRTSNKSFDFSFRRRFEQSKQKLIKALEDANKKMEAETPQPAQAVAQTAATEPTTVAVEESAVTTPVTTETKTEEDTKTETSSEQTDEAKPEGVGL